MEEEMDLLNVIYYIKGLFGSRTRINNIINPGTISALAINPYLYIKDSFDIKNVNPVFFLVRALIIPTSPLV